jgi:hypothetical protein
MSPHGQGTSPTGRAVWPAPPRTTMPRPEGSRCTDASRRGCTASCARGASRPVNDRRASGSRPGTSASAGRPYGRRWRCCAGGRAGRHRPAGQPRHTARPAGAAPALARLPGRRPVPPGQRRGPGAHPAPSGSRAPLRVDGRRRARPPHGSDVLRRRGPRGGRGVGPLPRPCPRHRLGPNGPAEPRYATRRAVTSRTRGLPSPRSPNSGRACSSTRNPACSSSRRTSPSRKDR